MTPPVQFLFSWFCVYLAKTEGAVNYIGLRLDCEKALSGIRAGWTSLRPISKLAFPNMPFVKNAFEDLASSRRCPSQMQAWRIIKELKDKKRQRFQIQLNANVKQFYLFESGYRRKDTGFECKKDSERKLQNMNFNKTVPQF